MNQRLLSNCNTSNDADAWMHFGQGDKELYYKYDPDTLLDQLEQEIEEEKRQSQITAIYKEVFDKLDDREQVVLTRYYVEGHSATKIADDLSYSRKTIYNIINRAREKVREMHKEVVKVLSL